MSEAVSVRYEKLPNGGFSVWIHQWAKFFAEPGDWGDGVFWCCASSDGGNPGRWVAAGNKDFLAATTPGEPIAIPADVKSGG